MDRREFISALTGGGAIAWLGTQVMSAQTVEGSPYANGVAFVPNPGEAGLSQAEVEALFAVDPSISADVQAQTFPQSVASGDPSPNGVVLWTRVDPSAQAGTFPNQIGWQIAATPDFAAVLIQGVAGIDGARDNTVKLPVSSPSLLPFTVYYYRFLYNGIATRTGRFKTLPSPTQALPTLQLGYVVCQDYGNGFYTALGHLAQEEVDYVVHLGDYIYETIGSPSFQNNPARTVPPFPSGSTTVPQSLADYRHLYQVYGSDPDQQAVHERFAYIQLWDDHEFGNDCHQDFHPDNNTSPNTATTAQPGLRQAANQAWAEYGLADVVFDPRKDWEDSVKVYRKFSFGTLADLIVTDERLYRDGPPCGDGITFGRYFSIGCPAMRNPARTMLGAAQKAWFLNEVTTSQATWKLWANEVMLMQLKAAGFLYVNLDQWDGYPQERNQILKAVSSANVKNFVALTGDLHTFLAGYLKTDFSNPFDSPVGVELMVGSLTSANLEEEILSAVHLPSAPVPAKGFGVPPNLLEPLVRLNNPHIQYWNSSTHGYGLLTITPSQLQCVFKAVTTIRAPTAELVKLRTFSIPVNRVRILQS